MSDGLVFEWDDKKRQITLEKHGIAFEDATSVFDGTELVRTTDFPGEPRWIAIGLVNGRETAVIFTKRGSAIRIITARRARDYERRAYYDYDAGRGEGPPRPDRLGKI